MKKLIIQIPCYNEEATIGITLTVLPREVPGVDIVEWLIIDDGSTDNTVKVALEHGVDHVVSLPRNQGLAKAFLAGLEACLSEKADIIVNTDADNQYRADDIPKLIEPILSGRSEIVIGARPISESEHFSVVKKYLQKLGSLVVRIVSNTDIPDAPSGFRAISRGAAMRLNVFTDYTYTLETIIQAGKKNMAISSVPVRINEELRQSRLLKSIPQYIRRSFLTIIRVFMAYKPLLFFMIPGAFSFGFGILISLRFLYFYFGGNGTGHVQSLILSALLMGIGLFFIVIGLVTDLIAVNRKLLEKIDWRIYQLEERIGQKNDGQ
jgi:glycosyltransferase involved in cell wall biosynthesis